MSLTQNETERVQEEAAATGADSGQIAAAVARLDAIKTAGEAPGATADARSLWELWKHEGAVIEHVDVGGVRLSQADKYVGVGGVDFSTPGYVAGVQ